jgi:hypothetical protein
LEPFGASPKHVSTSHPWYDAHPTLLVAGVVVVRFSVVKSCFFVDATTTSSGGKRWVKVSKPTDIKYSKKTKYSNTSRSTTKTRIQITDDKTKPGKTVKKTKSKKTVKKTKSRKTVKKTKTAMTRKRCPNGKKRNPATGRCVLKRSAI